MPRSFILIYLFLTIQQLTAQSLRVESISIQDGLSQSFVPCMLQDKEGFLWMGTKNGLNRYDGRNFEVFTHDPEQDFSISGDQIWSLAEVGNFILVGNGAGTLDFYHKLTRKFYHLPLSEVNSTKPSFTPQIMVDTRQNIWLVTGEFESARHLCLIRVPEGFWQQLDQHPEAIQSLKPEYILTKKIFSAVLFKNQELLYYNTPESCYALNTRTLQQTPIDWPAGSWPVVLDHDAEGNIWAAYLNRLSGIIGGQKQDFTLDFTINSFRGFVEPGLVVFGTTEEILAIPLAKIRAAGHASRDMAAWKIPCSENTLCKLQDISGNIWIGLNGQGILKIKPGFREIRHLFAGNSIYGPVFTESNGTIVAILPVDAFCFPDKKNSSSANFLQQSSSKILGNCRESTDQAGNRWLYLASRPLPKLVKIMPGGAQRIYEMPVFLRTAGNILADDAGIVWIAAEQTLLEFNTGNESWKIHSLKSIFPLIPEIYALAKTANGSLWLGTQRGLVEAKRDGNGDFTYQLYTAETGKLRNNIVSSLLPDPHQPHILWIATKGGGLSRLDLQSGAITHLHSRMGLPNDVLYGILSDTNGNLWMSSNKGIIRYHPQSGAMRNFTATDGLQSDEFNTWAYGYGPDGALMFGGINGLNVFHPEAFRDNPSVPPVLITGLSLNNQPVGIGDSTGVLAQSIEYLREIQLTYQQRSITLHFSALEYTASVKNRFKWMLEGAESGWHPETTEHSATYLNLQPGTYTFKVMASNGDGVWNSTPATLKIRVKPPWYRSIWAYLVYGALVGGLIYGYLRFRLSQLRLQQQLALQHLNSERLKELDKFKSQVFTNVSHEFRTPLTVILGMAEQLENQAQVSGSGVPVAPISLIKRNGQNLLRLINQILDLAKLESNALKINYIQGDILAYIRYIAESMHSLASIKNVLLRVESHVEQGKILMDYDPERMQHILYNLLSNAIKFTPAGGRVTLQVATLAQPSGPGKMMQITVSDTGAGIPTDALPRIFDRFFQAENQQHSHIGGSGIGLSLTQELVRLMGGEISVESTVTKGTTFKVNLPIHHSAAMTSESNEVFSVQPRFTFSPSAAENSERPVLLLIEDNPDVVEYLTVFLGDQYQLDFAYNGRSGIDRALETIPDLIISDVMMPEKDGFEVCENLKNDERSSHIPIVLLTAKAGVEDRIAGLRRGADAYLAKPFHPEELQTVLANLLVLRQKLQAKYAGSDWFAGAQNRTAPLIPLSPPVEELAIPISTSLREPDVEDAFLQKLRAAVETRLSDADLSVEELSKMLGMSYPVVHRKVTALTGRSLTLYVRTIRLQKARLLLADPALSISEVAYDTGFNDPKFFSRVFSEEFGMSPSTFRQRSSV